MKEIEKNEMRLKITSAILGAVGCIGLAASVYAGFNARNIAFKAMKGGKGWWKHHLVPIPIDLDENMTRGDFIVFDIIKTIAFCGTIISGMMIGLACKAKKAMCKQKPQFVHKMIMKSLFKVFLMILISMYIGHNIREAKDVIHKYR